MPIKKHQSKIACVLLIVWIVLAVFSCKDPYPGYTKAGEGIYYKLLKIGEQDKQCHYGDYVMAHIAYLTMDDSLFFSGIRKFRVTDPGFPGSIDKCFNLICEQDSAEFIISAFDFFEKTLETTIPDYLSVDGKMKVTIHLLAIQTQAEYNREKEAFLNWVDDLGEYEKVLLKQYVQDEKIDISPTEDGIYYVVKQAGNGPQVKQGDTITIHYEGHFLNGRLFDSTRQRDEPLQFVYGQQWQVIRGIEKAIGKMREGDKALVVIPSEQAFGVDGSSSGVVPPFTPVMFELELINVK